MFLAQYGDPQGIPVLYLHGGPGEGCSGDEISLFIDSGFHIYMLDQRAAGRSRSSGVLASNDLLSLLQDIEKVRNWAEVERWCLLGGSFGASLGYLYSCIYPGRVVSQVYWSMFIPSVAGAQWLYGLKGAAKQFPLKYLEFNPEGIEDLSLLFQHFTEGFHHPSSDVRDEFIRRWLAWELALAVPSIDSQTLNIDNARSLARLELHYAKHDYFGAYSLLQRVGADLMSPTVILQGEFDWVCPQTLVDEFLQQFGPERLTSRRVRDGEHTFANEAMCNAIAEAVQQMARYVKSL
nr:alpha/beta fold hydrolase [Shewanella sp. Isolate11]